MLYRLINVDLLQTAVYFLLQLQEFSISIMYMHYMSKDEAYHRYQYRLLWRPYVAVDGSSACIARQKLGKTFLS